MAKRYLTALPYFLFGVFAMYLLTEFGQQWLLQIPVIRELTEIFRSQK